jgi:ABC-2 type transport system ATP-binding protein
MTPTAPRVEVRSLRRTIGKTLAVDDVGFALSAGHVFGFVGPNGAGKTTTMRIMATLDEPDAGDVFVDGISVVDYPEEARRRIGYMPDSLPAHPDITSHEYLDFFGRAFGLRAQALRRAVDSVEEFTGLGELRHKTLAALSKGMKQRVSLARALIHDPAILILDEPAAGLDPRARIELRELVHALAAGGKTLLISSHILSELAELCNGVIIIERGRILQDGTLDDIAARQETTSRCVSLRALDADDVVRLVLLESPGVRDVRRAGAEWLVELEGGDPQAAALLAYLLERRLHVCAFQPRQASLEDIFMAVTKGDVA